MAAVLAALLDATAAAAQPAASTATFLPRIDPALVAWTALAVSGAAALLGAFALGAALAARRRAAEAAGTVERRQAPGSDPRTAERLARLEAAWRELAALAAAAPTDPAPAREPFPPSVAPRTPTSRPAPTDPPLRPETIPPREDLPAWTAELTDAFARLSRDPSAAAAAFIARHRPRAASLDANGVALQEGFEGAKLWAVRAPGDAEVWALTPGEQAVLNWSAHFAPQRRDVAAEVFGEAFDLLEGGGEALRMEAPALARRDASGRLSVRRRGRLSGFRS